MDVITIVWYVATFLALAAFFMLMACSDRRCRDMRGRQAGNGNANETQRAPPTPSPSYSEFAPPSYDTVIKMQHAAKTSIFVIPFEGEGNNNKANNNSNNNTDESITTSAVSILPASVYTIDERPKLVKWLSDDQMLLSSLSTYIWSHATPTTTTKTILWYLLCMHSFFSSAKFKMSSFCSRNALRPFCSAVWKCIFIVLHLVYKLAFIVVVKPYYYLFTHFNWYVSEGHSKCLRSERLKMRKICLHILR